jgi:hypothetical protein
MTDDEEKLLRKVNRFRRKKSDLADECAKRFWFKFYVSRTGEGDLQVQNESPADAKNRKDSDVTVVEVRPSPQTPLPEDRARGATTLFPLRLWDSAAA